jgi:hypothetical protein
MVKGALVVVVGLSILALYTGCDQQSAAVLDKLDAARVLQSGDLLMDQIQQQDRLQDQDQLQDGSCDQHLGPNRTARQTGIGNGDMDRLRDGSCKY